MNKNKLLQKFGNAKQIKQELFIWNSDESIKQKFIKDIMESNNLNKDFVESNLKESPTMFLFFNLCVFKNKCNRINYLSAIPHDIKTTPSLIKAYGEDWFKTEVAKYTIIE